jgi:hypothetical protein
MRNERSNHFFAKAGKFPGNIFSSRRLPVWGGHPLTPTIGEASWQIKRTSRTAKGNRTKDNSAKDNRVSADSHNPTRADSRAAAKVKASNPANSRPAKTASGSRTRTTNSNE